MLSAQKSNWSCWITLWIHLGNVIKRISVPKMECVIYQISTSGRSSSLTPWIRKMLFKWGFFCVSFSITGLKRMHFKIWFKGWLREWVKNSELGKICLIGNCCLLWAHTCIVWGHVKLRTRVVYIGFKPRIVSIALRGFFCLLKWATFPVNLFRWCHFLRVVFVYNSNSFLMAVAVGDLTWWSTTCSPINEPTAKTKDLG